jgi:hypothetical protein
MFEGIPDPDRSARNNPGALLIGAAGLLLSVAVVALFTFGAPRRVPWKVANGQLQIHARFIWNEDYPACDLQTDQAQVLDLSRDPGWLPAKKIYGFDGGGYSAGNFYVKNGKEVELALAKENRAVLLPRRNKVPVMVGAADPAALLSALRAACPATAAKMSD